jgi:3-oxoacyl-(acyl-carrier-protein) synthase
LSKVFITGMGMISAIGDTLAENHLSLLEGKCGITLATHLSSRYSGLLPLGEVPFSTKTLQESLRVSNPGITRTMLLALHASKEAIADACLTAAQLGSSDTALVCASTVGGMCLMDELYQDVNSRQEGSSFLSSYDSASTSLFLLGHYKMNGIVNTINTACSSSANAIMYGARLIKNGFARRAIVGGVDSLSKFTVNGFNALRILSSDLCAPFDENRRGLNLGEGSAFLILEREEDLAGKKAYAVISGYCNSNDAYHPSSLSKEGDGPFLSMKGALASAGLTANQIDFINAHGTGTENNDAAESWAMLRLFGAPPDFASTKSNTGHTLGAAGAMEAAYSILNLTYQEEYTSLHFKQPISATGLRPVTIYKKKPLSHVMSNSFAFGGNCTTLIFSKA